MSFLGLHFPDVFFTSSGVNADENLTYDLTAHRIGQNWGFEYFLRRAKRTNITDHHSSFLPVDEFVKKALQVQMETTLLLDNENSHCNNNINTPIDPIGLDESQMKFELAKLLRYGAKVMNSVENGAQRNEIISIVPKFGDQYDLIISKIIDNNSDRNFTIVDACMKASNYLELSKYSSLLKPYFSQAEKGAIYTNPFEIMKCEEVLCSVAWRNWLVSMSESCKVVIISPPLFSQEGNGLCDSFLASIWATKVIQLGI